MPVAPRERGRAYVFWWVLGLTGPLDAWLADDARRRSDYAFYRQELAAVRLAAGGRADERRWLLKDPCHLFSLDELFDTLPKARVVWLHRDPATVSASLCALLSKVWRLLYRARRRQPRRRGFTTPSSPTSANY